jgi:hypothetical protein
MKTRHALAILFTAFACSMCQKRSGHVHLTGLLFDWFDKKGIADAHITVMARSRGSSQDRFTLDESNTDGDGRFDRSPRAAYTNDYFIGMGSTLDANYHASYDLTIPPNGTKDFDTIAFSHGFTCLVNITYTSSGAGRSVTFLNSNNKNPIMAYSNASVIDMQNYSREEFINNKRSYILMYRYSSQTASEGRTLAIPVGTSDTVSAQINF